MADDDGRQAGPALPMRPTLRALLGRLVAEPPSADAHRVPARPRPHRPFDRLPSSRPQDPGLRPSRGRPFPHPAHPYDRGGADRPRARPRASSSTTTSPRRSRSATTSATRPSAIPARTRSTPAWPTIGGFDHNSHALAHRHRARARYAEFDGLNLTQPTLAGLVKHNGPLLDASGAPTERYRKRGVPEAILRYDRLQPLDLGLQPSLEAQAAALADDIAYDAHDIDDGLRAGLFTLADIRAVVPFIDDLVREIERPPSRPRGGARHPRADPAHYHPSSSRTRSARAGGGSPRRGRTAPRRSPAAGRALVGHSTGVRGGRPRREGVSLRPHVSPLLRAPGARRGRRDRAAAVSARIWLIRPPCRPTGRRRRRAASAAAQSRITLRE